MIRTGTLRRTSVYTLSLELHDLQRPDAVLDATLKRSWIGELAGSGANEDSIFLRLRVADDTEALRAARRLIVISNGPSEGKPRFKSAELSTGLGAHKRTIDLDALFPSR